MRLRIFKRELHRFVPTRDGSILWVRRPGTGGRVHDDVVERVYDAMVAQRFDEGDPYTVEVGHGDA